jgi:molecular chaperone GrpE
MEDKDKELPFEDAGPEGCPDGESGEASEPAELRNRLAYLTAEFENFRKRVAREREALAAFGNEQLLRAILPFLDNLERAMGQTSASTEGVLAGVKMSYEGLLAELRKFGLEQLAAEGEPFDPALHEAIARARREGSPEGTVLAEARKGYVLHGRLLRPAQVLVAAEPSGDETAGSEN